LDKFDIRFISESDEHFRITSEYFDDRDFSSSFCIDRLSGFEKVSVIPNVIFEADFGFLLKVASFVDPSTLCVLLKCSFSVELFEIICSLLELIDSFDELVLIIELDELLEGSEVNLLEMS